MFVPVEYSEPKDIRLSFKSFIKSCLPVDAPPAPDNSAQQQAKENLPPYLKDVEESSWMEQVSGKMLLIQVLQLKKSK